MKQHTPAPKRQRPIRMPESLMEQVDTIAAREQRSFNFMMVEAARLLVESKKPKMKRAYRKKNVTQEEKASEQ